MRTLSSTSLFVCIVAFSCLIAAEQVVCDHVDWRPQRVHLIDVADVGDGITNFLFRGNEPLILNKTTNELYWPMSAFRAQLALVAKNERNLSLPSSFFLSDVTLENKLMEKKDIATETSDLTHAKRMSLLKENDESQEGEVEVWSMIGDLSSPSKVSPALRKEIAKTLPKWQYDKLSARVPLLHQLLNTKRADNVSNVIYFHCERGLDRTGEMCGAYQMEILNWSFKDALSFANNVTNSSSNDDEEEEKNLGGTIKTASKHAMQWYCEYLKYGKKQGDRDCDSE